MASYYHPDNVQHVVPDFKPSPPQFNLLPIHCSLAFQWCSPMFVVSAMPCLVSIHFPASMALFLPVFASCFISTSPSNAILSYHFVPVNHKLKISFGTSYHPLLIMLTFPKFFCSQKTAGLVRVKAMDTFFIFPWVAGGGVGEWNDSKTPG